ncbi:unnamed protein product [Linum tenue]|uniref:AP complex mu/sigma subunit domain-containing protein n=1 Tax=Linum tenue TaxID=586396 RepID=A0AAV0PSD0_9ROSI|nr:unnamed protein product [Linum tenue]
MEADSIFGPDSRLVYKHYATLYFVFVFDSSENELAMLDLIQVFVETLDKCFRNVCELDIVFNYSKLHTILDEIIFGGQVLETSSAEVMKVVEEISRCFFLSLTHTQTQFQWLPDYLEHYQVTNLCVMQARISLKLYRISYQNSFWLEE